MLEVRQRTATPQGVACNCACAVTASADVIIDTVTVGNPGNAGEWSGESYGGYGPDRICGAVDYTYNIGKYEVTAGQYTAFLNAVAAHDNNGDHKSKEWGARRLATLYRIVDGKITRSEYPDAIFVIDGEWGDKDVARLYRSGWNRVIRINEFESALSEVLGIKKASNRPMLLWILWSGA